MIAAAVILLSTIATIVIAAIWLAPRLAPQRIVFDTRQDAPRPFGVRMAWIAVRSRDTARVAATLGLGEPQYANWATGLGAVYSPELGDRHVFVSPPVDGWTFVVGLPLPQPLGSGFVDKTTPLLEALGRQFMDVQYFLSYPALDLYAWARAVDGRIVRAFATSDAGVIWNVGKVTKEERSLALRVFATRTARPKASTIVIDPLQQLGEFHVQQIAAAWSVEPMRIGGRRAEPGLGLVGHPPAAWKPEIDRTRAAA